MQQKTNLTLISILTLILSGCTINPPQNLSLSGTPQSNSFVTDDREDLDYPGYMAGEGNIYSCHYGIAYFEDELLNPKPISILEHHLIQNHPEISKNNVSVNRFDIFYNWKEPLMQVAKHSVAGALSGVTGNTWVAKEGPLEGEIIGCENENLGEYYRSEVPVGYAAMVTYLDLNVDSRVIKVRNVTPIMVDGVPLKKELSPWIDKAIVNTFIELDKQISEKQ